LAIEVVGWVFTHSRSKNAARLVMLAVADACNNPDGTGAWMSNAALMAKTNLSERAVQAGVAGAELLGELKVERNRGRGGVNRFTVVMTSACPADSAPPPENPQNLRGADSAGFGGRDEEADAQATHGKGAESAGQADDEKGAESAPGTVRTKNSSSKSSSRDANTKPQSNRGGRLPADFHATADMIAWARENTPHVGAKETAAFIDHFRSAPGQKGVKLDWLATWRNWMRREQKRIDEQRERDRKREERWANNGAGYTGRREAPSPTRTIPREQQCPLHRGKPLDQNGDCRQCQIDAALEQAEKERT
jgi:hypothetical protein